MRRSNKAVKGKRKVAAKKARPAIRRRAVPERIRSNRHVDEVRPNAGKSVTEGIGSNAVPLRGHAISPADSSGSPQGLETEAVQIYPHATATVFAALQALFLFPLRSLQSRSVVSATAALKADGPLRAWPGGAAGGDPRLSAAAGQAPPAALRRGGERTLRCPAEARGRHGTLPEDRRDPVGGEARPVEPQRAVPPVADRQQRGRGILRSTACATGSDGPLPVDADGGGGGTRGRVDQRAHQGSAGRRQGARREAGRRPRLSACGPGRLAAGRDRRRSRRGCAMRTMQRTGWHLRWRPRGGRWAPMPACAPLPST